MDMISGYFFELTTWQKAACVIFALLLALAIYRQITKKSANIMDQVRADLFTLHGFITTVLHVFLASGFIACTILYNTHVLGHNPNSAPTKQSAGR